jgi:Cof subfamily protein (haloacid dehalogenase superfamily)
MTVRLIALDLDGTLFGDDLLISERTRRAIAAAQEAGILVTIATGRMFRSASHVAADLGISAPLICYQGALVRHYPSGEVQLHKTMPAQLAQEVIAATRAAGLHLNLYLNDELYVERITPEARYYSRINMDLAVNEVGDLSRWLESTGGQPTKLVIVTEPHQTDAVLADFSSRFGADLQVTKSHPRFTEFTNRDGSKGRALAFVAERHGMLRSEVMAIGDGLNDLDMLTWAGYGVAMKGAPESVLQASRIVCPPLELDGAADAIERYALQSSPDR